MMRLRRAKSQDLKSGGRKASKEQQRPRQNSISKPPTLPEFVHPTNEKLSNSFGGDLQADTSSVISGTTTTENYPGRPSIDPGRSFVSTVPIPPVPSYPAWDSYARTESMTNRGRYSYASSAVSTVNSPRRVRRRKDPTPLNILIVGTRGSGKTSFLQFLRSALAPPPKKRSRKNIDEDDGANRAIPNGNFIPHYLETEIDGERIGLTLWDSEGLEKNVVDLQLREMSAFLESKFEETFTEEMKVVRSPGVQDTHIHAVFLVLDPARLDRNLTTARKTSDGVQSDPKTGLAALTSRVAGALDEDLDLQVLRALQGKTTVIPVISKADTVTVKHMTVLKKSVWESLKKAGFDPLEALGLDEDEDSAIDTSRIEEVDEDARSVRSDDNGHPSSLRARGAAHAEEGDGLLHDENGVSPASSSPHSKRMSGGSIRRHKVAEEAKEEDAVPFLPLSIISPDLYEPGVVGRRFPWGFADPYDEGHCDFVRLKEAVFSEWRAELREASREQWYEGWRTSRLKHRDGLGRRR